MPIDVSILRQQAPMQMPSYAEAQARANQLISSDMQMAANMLQLQKAQREQQEQEQVRNLLTGGQFDVSIPESMSRLAAFGGAGREAAKTLGEAFKARKEGEAARLKGQESLLSVLKQQTEAAAGLLPSVKDYPSAKRYLDMVWSSPELAQRLRDAGQSPEADDKEVQEAIATGRLNDWLLRESRGAGDFAKRVGDQSALETALTAANEKFRTQSGADGRTVRVGFDLKGHTTEVVSNLMQQGRSDLAEQYMKQQMEMAKLKYAGLSPEAATLAAMRDDPELFEMARRLKAAGANRQTVKVGIGEQLSPGQKKVDEKFADDYVQWTSGDRARSEMGLSTMGNVIRDLKAGKTLSGPILALVPDALLAFSSTGAASVKAREDIERIVQEDLRATLGPQFTEKEGTGFLKRVFNPSLSGPQLLDRLERLYRQMDVARQQRDAMAEHFEANETLRGYKGPRPSLVDFQSSIFGGGKTDKGAAPAAAKTPDAFSDAEKERAYQEWKSKKK
jgi:hypothetical protein